MKNTKKTILLFLAVCTTALTYVSCSNNDSIVQQMDVTSVGASIAIDAVNEMDINTGLLITTPTASTGKPTETPPAGICGTLTVSPTTDTYPKVFTLDFGTAGCTTDQLTRKGKLQITVSGPVTTTGSKMTIERIGYSINGLKVEGTIEYTNTTTTPTVPQWTRKVTNGKLTDTQGKTFTSSGTCTVKQTAGVDTPFLLSDNVYEMTDGTHTVTSDKGGTLTLTVLETLVKKYSCTFISKGKLKVQGGALNGVVDYGNNDCDGKYTYTHENGKIFNLVM